MNPPVDYTEDTLVEKPAIALLEELGWTSFDAQHEFDAGLSNLGRENKSEAILKSRPRDDLLFLNTEAAPEAIHEAIAGQNPTLNDGFESFVHFGKECYGDYQNSLDCSSFEQTAQCSNCLIISAFVHPAFLHGGR